MIGSKRCRLETQDRDQEKTDHTDTLNPRPMPRQEQMQEAFEYRLTRKLIIAPLAIPRSPLLGGFFLDRSPQIRIAALCFRRAPMALRNAISLVLSVTLTSIIFITPMPRSSSIPEITVNTSSVAPS